MVADMPDNMTSIGRNVANGLLDARPSLLPFDPRDMMAIRVRPAAFARMCGVSRQTVSQWVKKGWVALGLDGLLDPVSATRQLLVHADPARLRARIFREATATMGELRARIQSLEAEAVATKMAMADTSPNDELAIRLDNMVAAAVDALNLNQVQQELLVDLACEHVLPQLAKVNDSRETPCTAGDTAL